MKHKLVQQQHRHTYTRSNRIPHRISRDFLSVRARANLDFFPSIDSSITRALLTWATARKYHRENRIATRTSCLITARNRGSSRRFGVSRIKIRELAIDGVFIGLQKSSF